jgi:hypothetical protein
MSEQVSNVNIAQNIVLSSDKREVLHKEIDLVQSIITRMAHNSFLVKGWSLAILSFSVAFSAHIGMNKLAMLLILPVLALWWLDSYYLKLERAYRRHYADILRKRLSSDDWSDIYDLNCQKDIKAEQWTFRIMFSSSTLPFHGVLFALLLFVGAGQSCAVRVLRTMFTTCSCQQAQVQPDNKPAK